MAPLNAQLEALKHQIEGLRLEIEAVKKRLDLYEKELDTSNALLARLEERLLSLVSIGKWILGIITTIGGSVLVAYITANFVK